MIILPEIVMHLACILVNDPVRQVRPIVHRSNNVVNQVEPDKDGRVERKRLVFQNAYGAVNCQIEAPCYLKLHEFADILIAVSAMHDRLQKMAEVLKNDSTLFVEDYALWVDCHRYDVIVVHEEGVLHARASERDELLASVLQLREAQLVKQNELISARHSSD